MPTILRIDGFEVVILTRDEHPPPHVHVYHAEEHIVIELDPLEVRECQMRPRNAAKAWLIVQNKQGLLLQRWIEIWKMRHG
ncbi:MAG TPA: DUF4160 domain-containing protein [Longimicrobiaceae bacterium]|nr:DUF4160 domain-containing protein [Longimicrobiaceae bacterium]